MAALGFRFPAARSASTASFCAFGSSPPTAGCEAVGFGGLRQFARSRWAPSAPGVADAAALLQVIAGGDPLMAPAWMCLFPITQPPCSNRCWFCGWALIKECFEQDGLGSRGAPPLNGRPAGPVQALGCELVDVSLPAASTTASLPIRDRPVGRLPQLAPLRRRQITATRSEQCRSLAEVTARSPPPKGLRGGATSHPDRAPMPCRPANMDATTRKAQASWRTFDPPRIFDRAFEGVDVAAQARRPPTTPSASRPRRCDPLAMYLRPTC